MTLTAATAAARSLRESLLDHGVKAVSIELVEGRAGSGWHTAQFVGTLGHHIVSRRSMGSTPGLALVKRGRSDLPGPLCNGYGGFDEVARIICMSWANHPGAGGPLTLQRGTIPQNNGRPYLFGWEFEGGLDQADWPDSMHAFMARCHAGTLAWLGVDQRSHAEHKTWAPSRKVDRLGYSLGAARSRIETALVKEAPMTDRITAKEIIEIGATPGLDATFKDVWAWLTDAKVLTAHTNPDGVIRAEELAAFLHRFHHNVTLPAIRNAGGGATGGIPYGATVKLTRP